MCDPLTLGALALTAGGTYMKSKADEQVSNKRNEYMNAENQRQSGFDRQAAEQFQRSLLGQGADTQKQQLAEQQQNIGQMLNQRVVSGEGSYLPSQADAPAVIRGIVDEKAREATEKSTQRGTSLGNLLGYGNQSLSNALGFTRSGENIANITRNMQGSANVLPLELQAANSAGRNSRTWGDILSGAGQVASLGSMAGYSPTWNSLGFGQSFPNIINAGALKTTPVTVSNLPPLA